MCCKAFWKRVVAFFLTLGFGVFISGFFVRNTINNAARQSENLPQSTFFNPPKVAGCINTLNELKERRTDISVWFENNKNASKKQKAAKQKELYELEVEIGTIEELKNFNEFNQKNNPHEKERVTNLYYKEKCYEF